MRLVLCWLVVGCPTPPKDSAPDVVDSTRGTDSEGTESTPTDSEPTDTGTTYLARDNDGDGYSWREGDCDDAHASVNPSMTEDCETWANDDCRGGPGNDGCWGSGFWEEYLVFNWEDSDPHPMVYAGSRFVGSYGKLVCDVGGTLVQSTDPAPACPDCLWAFRGEVAREDPWQYGPCGELVNFQDGGLDPRLWYDNSWAFSYSNPISGGSSEIGWLLKNDGEVDEYLPWEIWSGPGYDTYRSYAYSMAGEDNYIFTSFLDYNYYYYYWRYGEPVRDYNP